MCPSDKAIYGMTTQIRKYYQHSINVRYKNYTFTCKFTGFVIKIPIWPLKIKGETGISMSEITNGICKIVDIKLLRVSNVFVRSDVWF